MGTFLSIGTGPGIGYETALKFAEQGFHVVLSARNLEGVVKLADDLKGRGLSAEAHAIDVTDANGLAKFVEAIGERRGSIDVLHYNVANLRNATIDQQPRESIAADLATNVGGAMVAVQAACGKLIERREGTILLTGGGLGLYPNPDYLSLSIGKAAIRVLALGLFEDFKNKGVHIATVTVAGFVSPGSADTKAIASQFWELHTQPHSEWTAETVYEPQA